MHEGVADIEIPEPAAPDLVARETGRITPRQRAGGDPTGGAGRAMTDIPE